MALPEQICTRRAQLAGLRVSIHHELTFISIAVQLHDTNPMSNHLIKPIKDSINEEISLFGLWLRGLRRRATRYLPGLRRSEGDVRGDRGGLAIPNVLESAPNTAISEQDSKVSPDLETASPVNNFQAGLIHGKSTARLLEFGSSLPVTVQRVLLLDYDGTLAPFRTDRMEATPYPRVAELIAQIISSGDRVVIISGRLASEVASLIGLNPLPEIWGCHGWERLAGGELRRLPLPAKITERIHKAGYVLKNEGFQSRLEFKHGSLALHWRGVTEAAQSAMMTAGLRAMEAVEVAGLRLHRFDGGLELRATDRNKGVVVKEILASIDAGTPVAYLGDDMTDEDAFRVLTERGLGVLVRTESRETAASVWLKPPEELIEFLEFWLKSKQMILDRERS